MLKKMIKDSSSEVILTNIKNDLSSWSEWFDIRIHKIHNCEHNKEHYDTAILNVTSLETDSNPEAYWVMAKIWLAGEEEIQDGEAEELGEVMSSFFLSINYCPFCGSELKVTGST